MTVEVSALERLGPAGQWVQKVIGDSDGDISQRLRLTLAASPIKLLIGFVQLSIILVIFAVFTVLIPGPTKFVAVHKEVRIPGTSIVGAEAVQRLRARLECFSQQGKWVLNNTPRTLPWYIHGEDQYWLRCDREHAAQGGIYGAEADDVALGRKPGTWNVRETLKYEWRVDNATCGWQKFDRAGFCRAVGKGRNLMFVGDSLSWQHHITLLNHMNTNVPHPDFPPEVQDTLCHDHTLCADVLGGAGFNFTEKRNFYLSTQGALTLWKSNKRSWVQQSWFDGVGTFRASILVLNRGAWYVEDKNYSTELNETLVALRAAYPDLLIIFRNTVPGHPDCKSIPQRPFNESQTGFHVFNWENFARQNEIARRLVEAVDGIYMDVYTATVLRPDGHRSPDDCLHYCLPGPIDLWMQLLYNLLLHI